MELIYRISPETKTGKPRPAWFSKERCFDNCVRVFAPCNPRLGIIADGMTYEEGSAWATRVERHAHLYRWMRRIQCGQGGPAFLAALDIVVDDNTDNGTIVYLVEDDYLHRPGTAAVIHEGLDDLGFDYVTLYDHPDKYLTDGPNKLVKGGAEDTRLYLGPSCHWKETNSTTMTFACRLGTLREDADVFRRIGAGQAMPQDFATFCCLRETKRRRIGSPVPGYATHCETAWMAPLVDWDAIAGRRDRCQP